MYVVVCMYVFVCMDECMDVCNVCNVSTVGRWVVLIKYIFI